MSTSSWFSKSECLLSAQKVRDFYQTVLREFTERLYKENRFKVNGLDEETVQRLEKLTRENLSNPVRLFQKCITMKEGSRLEEVIKNEPVPEKEVPLKIEHVDEKDDYFAVPPPKPDEKEGHEREEEEYVDDLAEFEEVEQDPLKKQEEKDKRKVEVEVKKEDNYVVEYQSKNPVKAEEASESESDKNELSINECEEYLNCIILGTFSANSLKHKPKEEKTSIDLDNVFIKWNAGDAFLFGKLSVEAHKLEKDQIRKEFPYRPKNRSP